jgi:hypothetical protein
VRGDTAYNTCLCPSVDKWEFRDPEAAGALFGVFGRSAHSGDRFGGSRIN